MSIPRKTYTRQFYEDGEPRGYEIKGGEIVKIITGNGTVRIPRDRFGIVFYTPPRRDNPSGHIIAESSVKGFNRLLVKTLYHLKKLKLSHRIEHA